MSLRESKPALCDYRPVKFSHFSVEPGFRYMLTADPWGYLRVYLTEESTRRRPKSRWLKAIAFLDLAEGFYHAAAHAQHPTKGVLVYYTLLNLMKVVISTKGGIELGDSIEHHGLTLGPNDTIKVNCTSRDSQRNIFYEFAKCVGSRPHDASITLDEIMLNIPEIHELANSLLSNPGSRRFVPVRIEFVVDDRVENVRPRYIWTRMSYQKREEGQIRRLQDKLMRGARGDYFKLAHADGDEVIFESRQRKQLKHTKTNWATVYTNVRKSYQDFSLYSLLSRDGYRYYINLESPPLAQLCYPVLLCFYVGTLSRYRPVTLETLLSKSRGPIVNESLTICPRQFLYQIAGLVTDRVVVVPQASI